MVRVVTPCPRCRAVECVCGYVAERDRLKAERTKERGRRQREKRPYSAAERTLHASIIASHVEAHGWWCMGLPEINHRPHAVRPGELDVDDIVPVIQGGDRMDQRNKRVLCRKVNRGAARVFREHRHG
jgi:hypothetical protein